MKFEIPEQKKLVFQMVIPIRWGDMDAMNHVNNTTYFRYLETCRIDWMRSIGCGFWGQSPNSPSQMAGPSGATPGVAAKLASDPKTQGPVIVNAFCNFYKQLEYPGDVVMKMYVSDPGRTTFESWATLERADQPGVIYAAGGATTIWVDFPKQKATTLPDWMRELVS
ncbi:acyl-CoA thioesterase [Rhodoferax ferrireducens]|uniref:acyl-CoA thioesterase n=1 Tax=Rhodoferax ferrireducens TaxID=192843 RepID=UPI003BB74C70